MGIKTVNMITLLTILVTCTYSTCKKGGIGGCAETVYSFQIGETIIPDKDSIHVGDTLYLEVNTPSKLTDTQNRNVIDYSNTSNLGNVITLLRFTESDETLGAINNFNLFIIKYPVKIK